MADKDNKSKLTYHVWDKDNNEYDIPDEVVQQRGMDNFAKDFEGGYITMFDDKKQKVDVPIEDVGEYRKQGYMWYDTSGNATPINEVGKKPSPSKEKEQSQYPQEVKRGELKKPSLISQALGMMPKVDAGNIGREQKVGGMIANLLLGDNMQVQQPAQKEASPESKEAAPVTTPTGVVNNEGLMDAKLANYIENRKQRPDKQGSYFENMVADLLADGTANSNEEAVNMVLPALYRYANRSAMDVTNQVVSSLPDDTVQDAEQSIGAQWYSHGVQDKLKQEADSMGISYDDYVANHLKPAMVQSLVNKYGPNYRNIAEGIAARLYAHDEHVQERLMNQDINDALSSVINKYVSPSVVDEYNKAQEAGSKAFTEGMEGSQFIPANLRLGTALGAQYEANEAKDPAKVLSGLQQKFGKLYRNPKFLNDMINAAFKVMQRYGLNGTQSSDPKQFKPMINSVLKNELDQLEIKGMMPKGSAEYIMKTGLGNTIVGKITRKAMQTDYQNWLEDIANQQYQPGFWENVASGALTFAGDAWSYWLPGAAGGKLTKSMLAKAEGRLAGDLMAKGMERKMAERAAKVLIGKSKAAALKSGAVHGAVTFGGQSAISKPIDEIYRTGQFDENGKIYNPSVGKVIANTLGEVTKQSAVGAIMQGGTIANMVGKGRGLATNILADVGGKVVDSGIMTGHQMLERMAQDPNFKPTGKDAAESFLESMANLTAIGLPGMVGKYARFKDAREFNKKFDFTDQDIAELKRFGYDGLRDAFEKVGIGEYAVVGENAQRLDGQLTQKYMDLMNDKSVPEVLKAKMMAVVEGKRPSSFSPVVDSIILQPMDNGGKVYLETLNKDGGVVDRKEYSSLDEAQKADKKLEYEKTLGLASVLEGEFHKEFTQEHLEGLYNKAAQKYNMGEKLTDEDKAAVYLHQNAGAIKEIMDKQQKGIILTDEEQKQINAYRHYYDSALENSSVMREFVNTFEDSHGVARGTLRKALESKDKKYAPLVESYLKELYNSIELKREMKQTMDDLYNTSHGNEQKRIEGGNPVSPVEGSAGGQEPPVSEGPASYQDRTKSVPTPSDAEVAANPANVSNSSAEGASPETKVAGSDAFVMGQNAYKNGDSEALQAIDYNSDLATGRLQRAFADNEKMPDIVANAYNEGRDMEQFVAQRASSLTPAQKEAISKYVEAMDAKKGAIDALQHADDGYGESLKQQLWPYQTVDGNIVPATLDSGKQVFLKKANEYGGAFVVVPDEQGQPMIKQVSNAEIKEVGAPVSLDEYIESSLAQQKEARAQQFISQFDGSGLKPNDQVTVAMEEGDANIDMTFAGYSEDGKIVLTDGKDYLPLSKEEFAAWRKNALDNTINEHLDAEDAQRANDDAAKAEADKKQRYANGIVGLSEGQPDYSSKNTDPNVAAEYLQEQFGEDHGKLLNLVNGSRDDIKTQLANKKKAAAEYQDWLDTNADLDPEKAKKVEDELSLVNEQIADLDARFKNWNTIRNSVMTPDEVKAMKEERKAEIERAGIDKSSVLPDVDTGVRIPENSELKDKYPTQEAASGYITSERRRVYKMQEETQREIDGVDKILNQYMDGGMELSAEQLRDLNTTKAELANRQNALTADAKDLKGKAESLNILYIKERAEQNKKDLEALSPKDRRKELVAKALEEEDMKAIKEIYKDASTDVMDLAPRTLEEFVSERLFPHSLNAESLAQELGSFNFKRGIGSKYDTNKFNYLLAKKGEGLTINELAKRVWEDLSSTMESGDGLQSMYTDQDVRNAILDMFKTYDSVREMRNVTLLNRIAAAENELSGEEEWYEQQKEREIFEKQKEIDEYQSYIHDKELSLPSESELDYINGLEFDRMMEIEDREREYKQYVKSILPELADYDDRSNEEGYGGGSSLGSDSSRRGVDEGNSQGEEVGNGEASSESEIGEGSDSGRKGRQETGSMEPGEGSAVRGSHLPQEASFGERLKSAIAETETEPTEAQKKAGNYKKGHLSFGGYDYTVETPKGVTRSGKDEQGKPWSVTMHDTYGYILGKIGVDGDHIDMFINDSADLDTFDGNVYVVDQVNPETGEFDEHKVMYGYPSEDAATEAYLANYSKGWKGLGKVTSVPKATFDKWLESSDRKTKPFREYAMIQHEEAKKAKEEGEMLGFPAIDKEGEPINNHIIELVKWAKEQGLEIDPTSKLNSYADLFVMCKDDFGICTLVPDEGEDINQVVYFPDSAQVIDQLGKLQEEFNAGRDLKHSSNIDSELTEGVTFYDADTAREFKDFVNKKLEKQNKFHNKLNSKTIEVPEDATEENPLGSQLDQTNLPFHRDVKEVKPSEMTEAQKVAYDAVSTMLKKAGIPVKVVSNEDMEKVAEAQGKGVVYGYTDGKEIVLNQEHLNPNTPIHEYQHLWRTAAKEMNPDLIAHGDKLIKQTQLFADLKEDPNYKHLSDDEICDEAFARLTGEDGAAILEQMAKDAIKENPLDTAKELTIINRLKDWLKKFWYWTLDTFTKWKPEDIKKMTLEDIRNLVLRDLANGVDPRNVKSRMTKEDAVSLRKQMADNAEQERILEHTEENWQKEFGKDSRVTTPIGSIKLGENQYKKAGRNDRIKRFGLLKPTLERPDVILEKSAPKEGAERQTKYLFIKSFKKADGNKILNYESITVKQGEEEVAISAHQIDPSKVLKELTESKVLWNRFRGDSNSLGENQGSALTPSANNPSGKDSVLNPHSDANIRNNIETTKENGGNLSVEDKIKAVSQQFGVDEADVAMYANAVKKGSTAEAARARANIKRHLLQANEDKISSLKELLKYTVPVNNALKENFGDLDAMIEERKKQVEAQRNAMEAARKRAEEEEAKRQKHLEELSVIPDDQLDKQYMDALAKGDDATAREMLDEAARRKGYDDTESAYQGVGAWAAPGNPGYESDKARRDDWESSGSDVNLEDMALGYAPQPDDYFSHPERYSQNTPHGLESVKAINTAIDAIKNGEKDVKVKVYRAVPTSVKEGKLRNGDWVTPSKKYAEMHGTNRLEGKYRIIEDEVPATQLWWDGNDANEFGFDDGKAYKYKNAKNNRKLNDLVTYDDKGDVIPPSKRFNSRKSDIRFMFGGEKGAAEADKAEEKTYRMDNLKVAEIYSDKKGNLTAKSYYKTKKGVDQRVMEIKNSLLPTPEASSGSPLSDGKGINFFSIEQEKTAENERKIADSVVNTANKLGGAEATVYFSLDDVPEEYRSEIEQGAKGWYDPETHSVHVYLPNCEDGNDAQRTVFHEKIGHEGMEVLLGGEDGVRKFANFVYRSVGKDVRGKIIDFANKYDPDWKNPDRMNVGTQEYIAHLAEEGPKTAEDFSLWTKIKLYLIKVLKKLGVRVPGLLNDKDLRYYLMKAGKALHVWGNMPKEKQEAMMKQASNAEIKDALSNGPGKGKPQMKKGESMIQYIKRVQEWRKWKNAREDENDPEPPMFYDFDKDEAGKKEWAQLNKDWRDSHHLVGEEPTGMPIRMENEEDDAYMNRIHEYEKWQAAMNDQEDPMPDMFAFEKKKQEEVKRKYEDWLTRHELNEQNNADLDLYEGKIYSEQDLMNGRFLHPAETNPKADALEQQVMQDLAEVTSTDVSKEGAAKTVKHAVIHRRKNMEEASADDAIYINDVKNRIEKMADSGAFDKLLSDYKGKPNRAEKLAEAIPYIIEAPRRLRDLAHDLNATGAFEKGHIHIQPTDVEAIQPFVADLIAETAKMHTVLKDDKEVKVYDDPQAVSEVANKLAQAINANHQGEEDFVPIDGTDILSKHVLPLVKQQIVPVGIDYKNLSPEMKAAIDSIRDWYNYTYDWLKDNHTLREDTGYNADYVNHIWDKEKSDPEAYATFVENRQPTKSPNEKPRTISTLMEGISVGLVPKTTDITKMMAYYSRSNIEAWVNKTMLQELSGLNVIERNEDGEIVSSDALLSSTPPFNLEQYKYFEIPGVGPVWVYNVSPRQMKVKNPITGKERVLYSEASAGDRFGVVFESYQSSPFWKAFDTAASSAKKLELGFSGFHAGALTEVYMVQNMVEFGPKKAMANFMKYIFVDTMKNHQLPCFANPEDFQEAATHLVKFGATNDYAAADVQNMFDNLRDFAQKLQKKLEERGNIGTAAGAATIPFEIATQMVSMLNKGMDVALWDFLHDGLKLATYRMRADRTKERAKKYGWTDEQLSKALDEDGQFVNDMFGGQHWDIVGASQRTIRIAGRCLLSPDWNKSTTSHFLAITGFGSVWNEATFENFKEYYKHLWAAARGKGELTPEDWGRFSRQKSALLCYGIGFMVFYEGIANGINAAFRALDEEKERKKAEEIRKTNPSYKSMYELAYPDGMKWYDYLMRGNSLGQQSKIFLGRYEDGTEMYVRHGKQFREVPEYLFNHKGELEFPGPMVQRMIGKANPMVRMTLDDINYLSDFQASHADQEIQRKYGKTIGLLYKDALYWAPFLIPSQENKEFKAVDFFFPSSKGFSPWKAQSYFKDFILGGDMEGVVMTYQSCQRNGIDPEAQIKAAIGSVKALESAEMSDGVTSLQEASKRFDAAKSITEKKKMRQKMKKFLSQSEYKAFTQKEALDMVQGYLNGDEDLKEMEKAESKYLMKAKAEDVTEDWRIQNVWNGTMETYQEYQRLKDVDKAKANAFKDSKTNKRLFAARKAISAARRKMNKAKKQMDGQNDAAKLVEIRNTRKELLKTLNGME